MRVLSMFTSKNYALKILDILIKDNTKLFRGIARGAEGAPAPLFVIGLNCSTMLPGT